MFRAVRWLRGSGNRLFTMTTGTHDSAPAATAAIVVATGTAAATAAIPTTNTATATTSTSSNGTSDGPTPADVPSPVALPRVPIPPRGVDYRGKVVLAPMVRSGELPMRLMALHYGADLVWGPETVDRSLIGAKRRINPRTNMIEYTRLPSHTHSPAAQYEGNQESVIYRLDPVREAGKLVFQLGTADPNLAVEAARFVAPDVAGIDVNAGCPKPFSLSGGMGAALLRDPDRLVAILEALTREIPPQFGIGVSVKIRLLETAEKTEALVRRLVRTGITGLTVHCRTTPMRPREPAIRGQLRMIADVCREAGVACVVNGDVASRDHGMKLCTEFGTDGAMIATAAEKNPSCFRPADPESGTTPLAPWQELADKYIRFALEVENKIANTKFSLTQLIPGKAKEYKMVQACKSYTEIVKVLGLEGELGEVAREQDRLQALGEFEILKAKKKNQQQQQQQESKKRKREDEEAEEGRRKDERAVEANGAPTEPTAPTPESAVASISV